MEVLVVEDAVNWQHRLKHMLGKAGYAVSVAASVIDVSEVLASKDMPSLAIVDVGLVARDTQDRTGLEIIKRIGRIPTICFRRIWTRCMLQGYLMNVSQKPLSIRTHSMRKSSWRV